jgi:hypothetical protein
MLMKHAVLLALFLLIPVLTLGGSKRAKIISSPDKTMIARIITVDVRGDGNTESSIELRRANGSLIGIKNFTSKDHEHGFSIIKGEWTYDSKFFVFSTISSGGHQAGHFPTFFYSRIDNKIHMLDHFVGIWVTNPEFFIQAPDLLSVTVSDRLPNGELSYTISKTVHLGKLRE